MFSIEEYIIMILSYLLGSISFSYWFSRWMKGVDIREHGSGNAGATNTMRLLGKGPAFAVLILDALKGVLAVFLGLTLSHQVLVALLCGLAAILGHNWPIFLRFRGGKGIATTIGVTATLSFKGALISGVIAILLIVITRYVSLGSLSYTTLLPLIFFLLPELSIEYVWFSLILAILALWRHHENIRRLWRGEERRLKWGGENS